LDGSIDEGITANMFDALGLHHYSVINWSKKVHRQIFLKRIFHHNAKSLADGGVGNKA
jgi:hypothetical protein